MAGPEQIINGGIGLGYDPVAMTKGLAAIDGATTEVHRLLAAIQQEVDGLRSTWKAGSNVAFTQVHLRWADRAGKINNALQTMRDKLSATDLTYARTEQASIDQYRAIANSI